MITITIPTTGRPERLKNCIESIDYPADIRIGCRYPADLSDEIGNASVLYTENNIVDVQNTLAASARTDSYILPISDDIVFEKGAIKKAVDFLDSIFPDSDGIVGFNVDNLKSSPYCFMLIGQKFFNDTLKRKLFHDGYEHFFADTELGEAANAAGKFYLCCDANITHFHPSSGAEKDETHKRNRLKKWERDSATYRSRVKK